LRRRRSGKERTRLPLADRPPQALPLAGSGAPPPGLVAPPKQFVYSLSPSSTKKAVITATYKLRRPSIRARAILPLNGTRKCGCGGLQAGAARRRRLVGRASWSRTESKDEVLAPKRRNPI
jgi:hypothetical protein